MTLFKNIALISTIIGMGGFLLLNIFILFCCDKHIKFQVNLFRMTVLAMTIAFVSYIVTFLTK